MFVVNGDSGTPIASLVTVLCSAAKAERSTFSSFSTDWLARWSCLSRTSFASIAFVLFKQLLLRTTYLVDELAVVSSLGCTEVGGSAAGGGRCGCGRDGGVNVDGMGGRGRADGALDTVSLGIARLVTGRRRRLGSASLVADVVASALSFRELEPPPSLEPPADVPTFPAASCDSPSCSPESFSESSPITGRSKPLSSVNVPSSPATFTTCAEFAADPLSPR